jgi:hypothetical protein
MRDHGTVQLIGKFIYGSIFAIDLQGLKESDSSTFSESFSALAVLAPFALLANHSATARQDKLSGLFY